MGFKKMTAATLLKRLKKIKICIDKGGKTSLNEVCNEFLKTSVYSRAFMKHNPVHRLKNGTLRWNGLAVNLKLAETILKEGRETARLMAKAKRKIETAGSIQSRSVDINEMLDKTTLNKIAKSLGVSDNVDTSKTLEAILNSIKEIKGNISELRYDIDRIKSGMWDLHADHKERLAETITQQIGAQI